MNRSRIAALALATVLTVGAAGSAFAATSANVTESLTVLSSASISLDTATINYGTLIPGATSATFPVTATFSGLNGPTGGWSLDITGTTFTSGANTLPANTRVITGGVALAQAGLGHWTDSGPGTTTSATYSFKAVVPSGTVVGTYTGSTTFTVTGN